MARTRRPKRTKAAPGWLSLLAFLGIFVLLGLTLSWLVGLLGLPSQPLLDSPIPSLPAALGWLLAALLAHELQHRLGGLRLGFAGFPFQPGMYVQLGSGAALGLLLAAAVLTLGVAAGCFVSVRSGQPLPGLVRAGSQAFLLLAPLAAWEELVFRGVLQSWLAGRMRVGQAVVVQGVLFGLLHALLAPEAPELAVVGVSLAGVMLGLAFARTGTLWLPLGLHLAWNLGEGFVAGLPVSGHPVASTIFQTAIGDRLALLSGGAYGPEAGLLGIGAFAVGALLLWRVKLPWLPLEPLPPAGPGQEPPAATPA